MTESILKKLIKITEHSTKVSDRLQVDDEIPLDRNSFTPCNSFETCEANLPETYVLGDFNICAEIQVEIQVELRIDHNLATFYIKPNRLYEI